MATPRTDFDDAPATSVLTKPVKSETPSWGALPRLVPQSRVTSDAEDMLLAAELAARHFPGTDY